VLFRVIELHEQLEFEKLELYGEARRLKSSKKISDSTRSGQTTAQADFVLSPGIRRSDQEHFQKLTGTFLSKD